MTVEALKGLNEHSLRRELSSEVHARPFVALQPPERVSHLAFLTGEGGREEELRHLSALCSRFKVAPPPDNARFFYSDLGPFRLRWERHTEHTAYTFFVHERAPTAPDGGVDRFQSPVIERVPEDWLSKITGELLVAQHFEFEPSDAPEPTPEELVRLMGGENFAASLVSGGTARVWTNFAIAPDGFGRTLVQDRAMRPRQAGRLIQRLCEIESYRMLALLGFPLARQWGGELTRYGAMLAALMTQPQPHPEAAAVEDDRAVLNELSGLASEAERIAALTSYRFSATKAYGALVQRRIGELREERVEGYQTFQEFFERRHAPAMRTCEAVAARLDDLTRRLTQAGQLLRTRVEVKLEAQNQALLESMDRRAKLQLRLQQTVEGLSVAAITYYSVSLVNYLAEAVNSGGWSIPVDIITGLSIPVLAFLIWMGVRRVHKTLARQDGQT